MSKRDLLFRFAEDQFTKQNGDRDPATFSWLNLGILCLAFSFHLIRIISQEVLSFSTEAHASIHFTSINISLLIKAGVQTSLHLVILPMVNALHRSIFLPYLDCQTVLPGSFETLVGHIPAFRLLAEICRTAVHSYASARPTTGSLSEESKLFMALTVGLRNSVCSCERPSLTVPLIQLKLCLKYCCYFGLSN